MCEIPNSSGEIARLREALGGPRGARWWWWLNSEALELSDSLVKGPGLPVPLHRHL